MAQLIVRNIEDSLVKALKRRAVEHGHSAEEEHRQLLRETLSGESSPQPSLKDMLLSIPPGDDELVARHQDLGRPVDL